jgi:hypothetical protein
MLASLALTSMLFAQPPPQKQQPGKQQDECEQCWEALAEARQRARTLRQHTVPPLSAATLKADLRRLRSAVEQIGQRHAALLTTLTPQQRQHWHAELDQITRSQETLATNLEQLARDLERQTPDAKLIRKRALANERALVEWGLAQDRLTAGLRKPSSVRSSSFR